MIVFYDLLEINSVEKADQIENIKRVVNKSNKDLLSQIETLRNELQALKGHIAS
jgi:hypothetical protein